MASRNQNPSPPTCQETLHSFWQEKTDHGCHSLSKSSSALPISSSGGPQKKPEIHKSLTSIIYVTRCDDNSVVQPSQSSDWSSSRDCLQDLNVVKSDCNHLTVGQMLEKIHTKSHYHSAESSLETLEQDATKSFTRYNVSENISLLGHSETSMCTADSIENLDSPGKIVQKSYSDYFCGRRTLMHHSLRANNTFSATYSNLSVSSSISGSGSDGTCTLSNITQDSGIVHSPSNVPNNLTDVVFSEEEQNIPLSPLGGSTIQHNITMSGASQHGVLRPENSGNMFLSNDHIYSQPWYCISGIMSCDNIAENKLSPPTMIMHNSCSAHCNKDHETLIKSDDTIAAYCHSLPIPSIQYSSELVHSLGEPVSRHTLPQYCYQLPCPDKFSFPKLASSVSESGLDTKKLLRSGQLAFPPPRLSIEEINVLPLERNTSYLLLKTMETPLDDLEIPCSNTKTRDIWTMTSTNNLSLDHKNSLSCKDAEVQTVIIMESKAVSTSPYIQSSSRSHLFPDVGLGINLQCPQSPVREVRWDEEGMTWEVYGAAVDPEVLGLTIQKHLEIQIEQNTQSSEQLREKEQSNKEKRRSIRTVMQSFRQSNCCVCTTAMPE
ncbi:G protein-regulated inducer of neurite outgrowth 2 [Bufo bufo]|uniref:G protein-regulated inducer of neurite outgrowth 2 n=1 Tax=Bufo bufo TaxID=8384 RepID=UPI001ABDE85B|nr:G protein-regulated inducer of neurite outgrowth 2 [Bufo bufo]